MSEVAALLELLDGARQPYSSLSVRYRIWQDHKRAYAARRAHFERTGEHESTGVTRLNAARDPAKSELVVSVWRVMPDRARAELAGGSQDGSFGVIIGERWWSWAPGKGTRSSEQGKASWFGQGLDAFLDPTRLPGQLRFEHVAYGTRAGRPVIRATGWPRPLPSGVARRPSELNRFGGYAERYQFEFDTERALMLSAHAYSGSEPFQTIDAVEVRYDERIDPSVFKFQAP